MADEQVRFNIDSFFSDTGTKAASKSLKGLGGDLDKTSKATDKTTAKTKDLAKGFGVAKAAVSTFAAGAVAKATVELTQLGLQIERTDKSLNALTGGAADIYVDSITAATGDLVTEMEAARIATNMVGLGLVDSAQQAGELARAASILGGTFQGLGAEEAAENFGLLMSNMSVARLDTFGLSSAQVRAEIDLLMASTEGLSREMAFQQVVTQKATERADQLAGSFEGAATDAERAAASIRQLKEDLGEVLAEGFGPAIKATADFTRKLVEKRRAFAALEPTIQNNVDLHEDYHAGLIAATGGTRRQIEAFTEEGRAAQQAAKRLAEQNRVIDQYEQQANAAAAASEALAEAQEAEAEAIKQAEQVIRDYQQSLADSHAARVTLVQDTQALQSVLADLPAQYGSVIGAQEGQKVIAESFLGLLKETGLEYTLTGAALDQYMIQTGMATTQQLALAAAQETLVGALESGMITALEAGRIYEDLYTGDITDVDAAIGSVQAFNEQMATTSGILDEMRGADVGASMTEAAAPTEELSEALQRISEATGGIVENMPVFLATLEESMPMAIEQVTPLADQFTIAHDQMLAIMQVAPEMAAAMHENLAMLAGESGGLFLARSMVSGLYSDWFELAANPRLELEAIVNILTVGGAAGGANFFTSGPQLLLVGEAGREHVKVTPMTGGPKPPPITSASPNVIPMASGGQGVAGAGMAGGNTFHITMNAYGVNDPRRLMQMMDREIEKRLGRGVVN